jgi:hypothetical protein
MNPRAANSDDPEGEDRLLSEQAQSQQLQSQQLQSMCARGQELLLATDYLAAESVLLEAEAAALRLGDFDTLGRLYLPLQEARRQRRQRCGEGVICLDLIAGDADDPTIDPQAIARQFVRGQLLVAGWGSIAPAMALRDIQSRERIYLETFLAAVYPLRQGMAIVIAPFAQTPLPPAAESFASIDELARALPRGCLVLDRAELPKGQARGPQAYSNVMQLWERLHAPFLAAADALVEPLQKMDAYRQAIVVDYACELAHQRLSETALRFARESARRRAQQSA